MQTEFYFLDPIYSGRYQRVNIKAMNLEFLLETNNIFYFLPTKIQVHAFMVYWAMAVAHQSYTIHNPSIYFSWMKCEHNKFYPVSLFHNAEQFMLDGLPSQSMNQRVADDT